MTMDTEIADMFAHCLPAVAEAMKQARDHSDPDPPTEQGARFSSNIMQRISVTLNEHVIVGGVLFLPSAGFPVLASASYGTGS